MKNNRIRLTDEDVNELIQSFKEQERDEKPERERMRRIKDKAKRWKISYYKNCKHCSSGKIDEHRYEYPAEHKEAAIQKMISLEKELNNIDFTVIITSEEDDIPEAQLETL